MEIKELIALMWRNVRFLIVGLLLGVALGLLVSIIQRPVYEATTKILVSQTRQQSNADVLPLSTDQLVTTYLQLVKTQPVLDDASSQLNTKIKAESIQVAVISNTQIIQVKVQDSDARRAADIANALFQILVQQNETLQSGRYQTYEDALNIRINLVQQQISDLQGQVNQIDTTIIQDQLKQVNQEIDTLQGEMSALDQDILQYPTFLTDVQRASLAEKQAELDQHRILLSFYQQIKANLTYLGNPGQGSAPNNDPRLASLQATLNVYQQLNLTLLNNLESVRLAQMQNTPNVTQIDPAIPPKIPIRPMPLLYVLLGGIVGFILAAGTILVMEHFDDSLKMPDQIEDLLNLPVLGLVSDGLTTGNGLITSGGTLPADTEAFRDLALTLEMIGVEKKFSTLLVTDAGPAGNKTTIAANLALMNAQQGKRVVLLDCDLQTPHLHELFEIDNQPGVVDLIKGGVDIKSASHKVKDIDCIDCITLIPSGVTPEGSTGWLDAEEMAKLFVKLQKQADLVIVDGPSAEFADAQLLASKMDAVLLIIQAGYTRADSAQAVMKRFQSVNARMVGAVLNQNTQPRTINTRLFDWVKIKPTLRKEPTEVTAEMDVVSPS